MHCFQLYCYFGLIYLRMFPELAIGRGSAVALQRIESTYGVPHVCGAGEAPFSQVGNT